MGDSLGSDWAPVGFPEELSTLLGKSGQKCDVSSETRDSEVYINSYYLKLVSGETLGFKFRVRMRASR